MVEMILRRQWIVLPYDEVKDLPGLRLSPIGVVPQRDRRPRTIVDYSFYGVNDETCRLAPEEAMRFGQAFQRLIEDIVNADPKYGPVHLCKVDISDGFYRVWLRLEDIPKLGVAFPTEVQGQHLVAFPLVLPMGWVSSPPYFCAATETVADVSNARIMLGDKPARHRLDRVADSEPVLDSSTSPSHSYRPLRRPSGPKRPLGRFEVYVDDFCGVVQGGKRRRRRVRRVLFDTLDRVFRPIDGDDPPLRQEPVSVKKLRKGDASWGTRKQILGWLVDTIASTLELPPHRRERLIAILDLIPSTQKRVSLKKWHSILGELRSMTVALLGSRGLFSHLQSALRTVQKGRIRVTRHVKATLDDFRWLAANLDSRPTRLQELAATSPAVFGTTDACGLGMGGGSSSYQIPPPRIDKRLMRVHLLCGATVSPRTLSMTWSHMTTQAAGPQTRTWSSPPLSSNTTSFATTTTSANAPHTTAQTTLQHSAGSIEDPSPPTQLQPTSSVCKHYIRDTIATSRVTLTCPASSMPWPMMRPVCGIFLTTNF